MPDNINELPASSELLIKVLRDISFPVSIKLHFNDLCKIRLIPAGVWYIISRYVYPDH